jgi:hypothetical protein
MRMRRITSSSVARLTLLYFYTIFHKRLWAGRSGDRIPVKARFSAPVQTGPEAHPSLLYNGYRVFPGGKLRPGCDANPSPPSNAEVKNRVELYLYSPLGPSWPMKGWNLPISQTTRFSNKGYCIRNLCFNFVYEFIMKYFYLEIKCQIDATDYFYCQILLLAQHVSGKTILIIRSSRVLYSSTPYRQLENQNTKYHRQQPPV